MVIDFKLISYSFLSDSFQIFCLITVKSFMLQKNRALLIIQGKLRMNVYELFNQKTKICI